MKQYPSFGGMKRIFVAVLIAAVLLPVLVASATQTNVYSGWSSSNKYLEVPITTLRDGDIVVHATFDVSNHGLYQLNIFDAQDNFVCRSTLDARWGRATVGDMTCSTLGWGGLPMPTAGNYRVEFYPAMGGKTFVVLKVTTETD